jgi:hypothetical protein
MKTMLAVIALSAGLSAAPPLAVAEPSGAAMFAATTLDVSAIGETKMRPDMAMLQLGVDTTAATAAAALGENAQSMSRVVAALRSAGIAERDIQTTQINLSPQYVYEQNRPPRLTGYQAANRVNVEVRDLAKLGPVADAVVAAGATNIGDISFGLAEPGPPEDSARVAAVKALEAKANLYAQAAGYRVARLVSLSETSGEQGPPPPRPMMAMRMQAAAAPTPVEAGEMTVRVSVSGLFELAR